MRDGIFHAQSLVLHDRNIFLLLFIVLCVVNEFSSTRWMGMTFSACVHTMTSFLVVFCAVIVVTAFYLMTKYSDDFQQFGSIEHSLLAMLSFTFQLPADLATDEDDVYTII